MFVWLFSPPSSIVITNPKRAHTDAARAISNVSNECVRGKEIVNVV